MIVSTPQVLHRACSARPSARPLFTVPTYVSLLVCVLMHVCAVLRVCGSACASPKLLLLLSAPLVKSV